MKGLCTCGLGFMGLGLYLELFLVSHTLERPALSSRKPPGG